jgi:hypothetical protein
MRELPEDYSKILGEWRRWGWIWYIVMLVLGTTGTVSSVVVAVLAASKGPQNATTATFGLLSALATGLMTFYKAPQSCWAFFHAWRILHTASVRFRNIETTTPEALQSAFEEAESIIAKSGQ